MRTGTSPLDVYERVVALGGGASHAGRVADMRRDFEARTGEFAATGKSSVDPRDRSGARLDLAWFEARSRAFWDDAIVRQRFGRDVERELEDGVRGWLDAFERAHRGLFRLASAAVVDDAPTVVVDVWGGAEFTVHDADGSTREALEAASGLFDARLVAGIEPARVAILPGAVYHPEDAIEAIERVIEAAHTRGFDPCIEGTTDAFLDALLRMERTQRSLSRVKPGYAYRPEALGSRER